MAIKTREELLAEFPDNALRGTPTEVTAEKIRDFIDSLGVAGTLYFNNQSFPVTTEWVPVTIFTNANDEYGITSNLLTGELVVGAGSDRAFSVKSAINVLYEGGATGSIEFAIHKNGNLTPYKCKITLSPDEDAQAVIFGSGRLVAGDRIGLKVRASGNVTLTGTNGQFSIN